MRIGILTGGGDSPATNAAIRAVVKKAKQGGHEVLGIRNGWAGLIEGLVEAVKPGEVSGILPKGGTILGTSRTNPFKLDKVQEIRNTIADQQIDALIAIGGDDTLGVLHRLNQLEEPVVGVGIPQTIDNDIPGTDYAIGFDSAVAIATDACDKLHTTAESHHRVMILEVMGRDAGHIALEAGLAGGADIILIPEEPFEIEAICDRINRRKERGKTFSIIVVAEGAKPVGHDQVIKTQKTDQFGHVLLGGVGEYLAAEVEKCVNIETRVTILGHLQRGGIPTPYDRLLATRFGVAAVEMVDAKKWDHMVALKGSSITAVPLEEGLSGVKPVEKALFETANLFF
jgi:ATP-dependent phosphofructokinase / diphosphate-dependent phosphofructokinase